MYFSERLMNLAIELSFADDKDGKAMEIARELNEIAMKLGEVERFGELDSIDGDFPTPLQGLALARFLRQVMRDERIEASPGDAWARVSRSHNGVGGVSENYLGVVLGDGYCGGIDRNGVTST